MDEWPMRHGLGFYSDAAYVPIGASREQITFPGGQIPFIAPNGVQVHEFVRLMQQSLAPSHPEGTPQFILAAEEVGELLEWRLRLYLLLSAFAVVSLLVGGFGIMNVLFVWVVNRWREIGVRRAVGASRADVARMVLGQGLQITLFAALAGGTAGTLLALVIQYASGWPLTLYLSWLAIACGVAIVAALVFGGLPAWWAASRAPTEMLRME
jgi:ABC-type antimicrobial peptide transport system permease subunit